MISYRSVFLFPSTNLFPWCSTSTQAFQHVERRCGLPNKANVAFACSFVSPQFIPRIGSPTPSSVSISLPFACPKIFFFYFNFPSCCHVSTVQQHCFFIWRALTLYRLYWCIHLPPAVDQKELTIFTRFFTVIPDRLVQANDWALSTPLLNIIPSSGEFSRHIRGKIHSSFNT